MTSARKLPWMRLVLEGVVVVGSILLAFAIDALWQERQDRQEERVLLADLIAEFEDNRDRLVRNIDSHRRRDERLGVLIREAGPERVGLDPDSLRTLTREVFISPIFNVERGVLDRTMSGGGLALIRDPDLRSELAGFWTRFEFYFENQYHVTRHLLFSEPVAFGTGTVVWPQFSDRAALTPTPLWSSPPTPEQENALKHLVMTQVMSELLTNQGERMLRYIEALLDSLEEARAG